MPWVQYTRNFEDVILRRVLKDIERGCFLDVGAFDAVVDSNTTYALYECGWRGIAVEPQTEAAPRWSELRPEDVFVSTAAGSRPGTKEFPLSSRELCRRRQPKGTMPSYCNGAAFNY